MHCLYGIFVCQNAVLLERFIACVLERTLPLLFTGIRRMGTINDGASMSWTLDNTGGLPNAGLLGLPFAIDNGVTTLHWRHFTLQPSALQGNYNFGSVMFMQLCINRLCPMYVSATTYTTPGRLILYSQAFAQVFIFGPDKLTALPASSNLVQFENYNAFVPVFVNANGMLDIWVEDDNLSGVPSLFESFFSFNLFNFNPINYVRL